MLTESEIEELRTNPYKFYDWCQTNITNEAVLRLAQVNNEYYPDNKIPHFGKIKDIHSLKEWRALFKNTTNNEQIYKSNYIIQLILNSDPMTFFAAMNQYLGIIFELKVKTPEKDLWVSFI